MKPFSARFALTCSRYDDSERVSDVAYDSTLDVLVLTDSHLPVVESEGLRLDLTGTLVTNAGQDPTRDEPTDR